MKCYEEDPSSWSHVVAIQCLETWLSATLKFPFRLATQVAGPPNWPVSLETLTCCHSTATFQHMPGMDWDRIRRGELFKHDDVTLRTGRRQGVAESGPSSDGTPTRAERRQARLPFLYSLDGCARTGCSVRLVLREDRAILSFEGSSSEVIEFPVTIVGNSPRSPIDSAVTCSSPQEVAKALRYKHSPKCWWPLRLELHPVTTDGRSLLRASLRVEEPGTSASRLPIGDLTDG